MKHIRYGLAIFLWVVVMAACSCGIETVESETDFQTEQATETEAETETEKETVTETETETAPETEAETEPPLSPEDMECRTVDAWKSVAVAWSRETETVIVDLPLQWELKAYDSETYIFLSDGRDIGDICIGEPTRAIAIEHSEVYARDGIELCYQIRRVKEGNGENFRRLFGFYEDTAEGSRAFFLQVDYTEMDDDAARHICDSFARGSRSDLLRVSLDGGNASKKVLVAGNSFVRTSGVGVFLTQFFENAARPYEVEWISTSSVTVSFYLKDEWIERVRSGEFHAIAMCGLYYTSDVTGLKRLVDACRASDTTLVMFPAYNESNAQIAAAVFTYPDLKVVNWKAEINRFIDAGMDKYDFCIKDSYLHSKPLAGYVGAHMLYTTFFNQLPPDYVGSDPLDMEYIRGKLGEQYVLTGVASGERVSMLIEWE